MNEHIFTLDVRDDIRSACSPLGESIAQGAQRALLGIADVAVEIV